MSPILIAALLGQIKPDTGSLSEMVTKAGDKAAKWFLPTVTPAGALPIVPDGAVAGARYIPPNTVVNTVASSTGLETAVKRIMAVSAAGGAVLGGLVVWVLRRK